MAHLLWYQTKSELLKQKSLMFALDPTFLSFPIPVFFSLPTKRLAVEWGEKQRPRLPSSWRSWRRPIPHVEIDGGVGNSPRRRVINWLEVKPGDFSLRKLRWNPKITHLPRKIIGTKPFTMVFPSNFQGCIQNSEGPQKKHSAVAQKIISPTSNFWDWLPYDRWMVA